MDTLSAHRALQLATNAVPIIKHLTATNKRMSLKEFGQALGIVTQAWKPHHHEQIHTVLAVVQATFHRLDEPALQVERVTQAGQQEGHWYRGYWKTTGAN
jgi:hypothetical protein